ncbi:ABC transporter permease [Natrialbaceae archaeon A-arb3/5]
MGTLNEKRKQLLLPIVGIVGMLVLWEGVTSGLGTVSEVVLPAPTTVLSEFSGSSDLIIQSTETTVFAGFVGFLIVVVLAPLCAIALTLNDRVEKAFMPLVVGVNSVPRVTVIPLLVFYFGDDIGTGYIIAAWVAFFPLFLNAFEGFSRLNDDHRSLLSMYNASVWQEYRYVRLPNGLPRVFDGMKIAFTLAMIGAVVGEFIMREGGLGHLAMIGMRTANTGLVFASVFVIGIISTVSIFLLYLLQDRLVFWEETNFFTTE